MLAYFLNFEGGKSRALENLWSLNQSLIFTLKNALKLFPEGSNNDKVLGGYTLEVVVIVTINDANTIRICALA